MKSHSVRALKYGLKISNFKLHLKHASTQAQKNEVQESIQGLNGTVQISKQRNERLKKKVLFSPDLSRKRIQELETVTGVAIVTNYVSWAKISVPTLTIVKWDSFALPCNFINNSKEPEVVELAYKTSIKIPNSDLYIMEGLHYKTTAYPNNICLRLMLVLLLNGLKYDSKDPKVVFQKPSVVNNVHSLLISGERTSIKNALKSKCIKLSESEDEKEIKNNGSCDFYSSINIESDQKHTFDNYPTGKQECLSLALLTVLTFLDVSVFQNPGSISKIHRKVQYKAIVDKFI